MQDLIKRYAKHYGYTPSIAELYSLYAQGELVLSDKDENALLKAVQAA